MDKKTPEIIVAIAFAIVLSYFLIGNPTGQAIFEPDTPQNCTDSNITAIWDSIFNEPFSGTTSIVFDDLPETEYCDNYMALKLINDEELFLLRGKELYSGKEINAIHGNFSSNYINDVGLVDGFELTEAHVSDLFTIENLISNSSTIRDIGTAEMAKNNFSDIFKISTGTWTFISEINIYNHSEYGADAEGFSLISKEKLVEGYLYKERGICIPVWIEKSTACNVSDLQTKYYDDNNNCNNDSTYPGNETARCDYDSNNVIGSTSSADTTRVSMEVKIEDTALSDSTTYSGEKNITILDDDEPIIEFKWDFDSELLNLYEVQIIKQPSSSDFGYLIVEGINATKTLKVDKVDSNSNSICIKDSSVSNINSISDDCDGSNEYLISCPGSSDGYTCSVSSGQFVVSGLNHSAIKEVTDDNATATTNCTPDWNCSSWSTCSNETRTRTCTDDNSCGNNTGKPIESESCETTNTTTTCFPDWDCTEWSPTECPASATQTRTCTDQNSCGISSGKPLESSSCTPPTSNEDDEGGSSVLFFIILIMIIGIIGFLAFWFLRKKSEDTGTTQTGATPPAPPMSPGPRLPMQPPRRMMPKRPIPIRKPMTPPPKQF